MKKFKDLFQLEIIYMLLHKIVEEKRIYLD